MKHLTLMLLLFSLLIVINSNVNSAEVQTLGTVKQNECLTLTQLCSDCTFVNLTSVIYPNKTKVDYNILMTKNGFDYSYSFCNTQDLGFYIYNTVGDPSGTLVTQPVQFEVTGNGKTSPEGVVIVLFVIIFLIILSGLIYMIVYSIGHFKELDFDLKDLAYNYTLYFLLLGSYMLEIFYLGNPQIETFYLWIIGSAGFTNMILPTIAFLMSYTVGGLKRRRLQNG